MSARFHTSAPTHRAFMTRKQWQHPSRREHIHGKLHQERMCGLQWVSTIGSLILVALIVAYFGGQFLIRGVP